jgi:hypothetical protein
MGSEVWECQCKCHNPTEALLHDRACCSACPSCTRKVRNEHWCFVSHDRMCNHRMARMLTEEMPPPPNLLLEG